MSKSTYSKAFIGLAALAAQANAFWRLPCSAPVVVERADPIIDPGAVSKHVHTVMGTNGFNFTMNSNSVAAATCSTCKVVEDMSAYWVPSLYFHAQNGSFIPVKQTGGATIYYLQRSDSRDPSAAEGLVTFPKDFRMVAGNPSLRNYTNTLEQRAVSFVCLGTEGPATNALPNKNCPSGLRAQLNFPSCWDGVNIDSANHKSHMAYPSGMDTGFCPQTHPKRFITLFYEVVWSVDEFKDMWYGDKQPFVFAQGDPTGYGYHGDFVNGWDLPVLQKAINECTDASGNVEYCKAFSFRQNDDMNSCRVLPRVNEPIGGVLPALPGCNPIQPGPEPAVTQSGCGAVTQIGDPVMPFTDVTARLGWKNLMCAKDIQGSTRTLDGYWTDTKDMTVDKCVKLCGDRAYKYAGVEFSSQCFCGNNIAPDRLPTNGTLGYCNMPCSGDPNQLCGGAARVSIYEKCAPGAACENMKIF